MENYFKLNPTSEISREEIYNMVKILLTPDDILIKYMKLANSKGSQFLNQFYRNVCL